MRFLVRVFFFLFCLLWGPSVLSQNGNFLDLTKARPTAIDKMTGKGEGGGAAVGHMRKPRSNPFKVTLLSLHKHSYYIGEEVIYDILLENVTNDSIVIPWSPDQDKAKPNETKIPPGYIEAFLSLVITDEISGEQLIAGQGIYGSELVPRSLKRLGPKQSVRIRAPGSLIFFNADVARRMLTKLPRKVEVRARYTLQERSFNSQFEPATSENTLLVEVKKRQE